MKATAATLLLVALLLAGSGPVTAAASVAGGRAAAFHEVATQVCTCGSAGGGSGVAPGAMRLSAALAPTPVYDEQIGSTFTQSFTSLAFNVTAVEQTDPVSGDGPAYLLDGLGNSGFWYQVGVSWNWNPGGTPGTGFDMNYEVFNTRGESIFPVNGEGGLQAFSGPVNEGDSILLNLYFSSADVVMTAHDWNTGASASESFSADGSTVFDGDTTSNANSNGYFTGLMTEWYHPSPYTSNEKEVVYSESGLSLTSAWLWMDEYDPDNGQSIFANETSSPVSFGSNPTALQEFASNGATEYADANEFITGALNATVQVPLTFSYAVADGGTGFSAPVLQYVSDGTSVNATLETTPVTYNLDGGSSWRVDAALTGSTTSERWETAGQTAGTAESAETIQLTYYHQYAASVAYEVEDGGAPVPTFTYESFGTGSNSSVAAQPQVYWLDAGSGWGMTNPVAGSSSSERWTSEGGTNGTVTGPLDISPTYFHQYLVSASYSIAGGGHFTSGMVPEVTGTTVGVPILATIVSSPSPLWLDAGSAYAVTPTIGNSTAGTATMDQRWVTNDTGGSVTEGLVVDPQYQHQYLVTFGSSPSEGGSSSSSGGWYDVGAQVEASATAGPGWTLGYWESDASSLPVSTDAQLSITVEGFVNDTAVFYPGLTITAGQDLAVSYSYPATVAGNVTVRGSVPAGQSEVVYVPPSGLQLSAASTSLLYSFKGWSGARTSTDHSITLSVSGPSSITAESTYNLGNIGIALGAVLLAVVAIAAVAGRRKKTAGSPAA